MKIYLCAWLIVLTSSAYAGAISCKGANLYLATNVIDTTATLSNDNGTLPYGDLSCKETSNPGLGDILCGTIQPGAAGYIVHISILSNGKRQALVTKLASDGSRQKLPALDCAP